MVGIEHHDHPQSPGVGFGPAGRADEVVSGGGGAPWEPPQPETGRAVARTPGTPTGKIFNVSGGRLAVAIPSAVGCRDIPVHLRRGSGR